MHKVLRVFFGLTALIGLQSAAATGAYAQQLGQPKVAVYNFKDEQNSGRATELRDMITTAVIESGKFTVFSRDFASAEEEAQLSRAGKTTRARTKVQAEAIDYTIEGSITSAQFTQEGDSTGKAIDNLLFGGKGVTDGCVSGIFSVSIDVVVKHVGTQETPYATSLTRSQESKCKRGGSAVDFPAVMRSIADELAKDFATRIYPIKVIAVQADGGVVFNYGDSVLPAGTFLKVYGPGEEILSDGKMLTMDGPYLGRVQITNANPETARAGIEGTPAGQIIVGSIASIDDNQLPAKPEKKKKGK